MKKIQKLAVLLGLAPIVVFSSCSNEFLDRKPTTALETSMVLDDPDMAPTTVVGNMSMFSGEGFMGRNAVIGGDLMTDVAVTMGRAGHLQDLEKWNIQPNTDELAGFWSYCYAISAASTQTSYSCLKLLRDSANLHLTSAQVKTLRNAVACSKVIRAYCDFYLMQNFCVDINLPEDGEDGVPGTNKSRIARNGDKGIVGIVLIGNKPLGINAKKDPANMSKLQDCYKALEKTLEEAIAFFDESSTTAYLPAPESRYFPTLCAAYVLQARVFLAQAPSHPEYYEKAKTAADNALGKLPSNTSKDLISNYETLYEGYKSAAATSEDIWSINYTSQDNLSANSLQNFFDSYGCYISSNITSKFQSNDFRSKLYPTESKESRCLKYPNSNAVFNVPVMRVPELYLIKAEVAAAQENKAEMLNNLFEILKARDTSVHELADIEGGKYRYGNASTKEDMIKIVLDERVKEYAGEGYRWSDLRRNANYGVRLNRPGTTDKPMYLLHFVNYNLARYALPVPFDETSTAQWSNGKGIISVNADGTPAEKDTRNWQNNAWEGGDNVNYNLSSSDLDPNNNKYKVQESGN